MAGSGQAVKVIYRLFLSLECVSAARQDKKPQFQASFASPRAVCGRDKPRYAPGNAKPSLKTGKNPQFAGTGEICPKENLWQLKQKQNMKQEEIC